jgi:hypothetical protein
MNEIKMEQIIDGYENYFNFMYGAKIVAIKDLIEKEIEWIDMNRGTTLMIFYLRKMKRGIKIEVESIRHLLIDRLLDEGFLALLGHEVEFYIREEEKIHRFFKLLEEIKYFEI